MSSFFAGLVSSTFLTAKNLMYAFGYARMHACKYVHFYLVNLSLKTIKKEKKFDSDVDDSLY